MPTLTRIRNTRKDSEIAAEPVADELDSERTVPPIACVDVEAWGLVASFPAERQYSFVDGPWDSRSPDEYPENIIPCGDLLLQAIDEVAPVGLGPWEGPRHFRVWVEEVGGLDVSPLVTQDKPVTGTKLSNPRFRQHIKIAEQQALEDYREGQITAKQVRASVRAGTDARVVDILSLVRQQIDTMQLRYMGRYTSYYIDKYEALRLIDQLVEDIVNGRTNIERVLRYELGNHAPEDWRSQKWLQQGFDGGGDSEKGVRRTTNRRQPRA